MRGTMHSRVEQLGWAALFKQYDSDGSGDLDFNEFARAVRTDCALPVEAVTNEELQELFCM
eukprot:SAG11_NODE_5025_length_1687_cov_1.195844_3_plen_61_part_00